MHAAWLADQIILQEFVIETTSPVGHASTVQLRYSVLRALHEKV